MSFRRGLALLGCASLPLLAGGGLLMPDLDLKFRNEFQSAYISTSSGSPGETRPVLSQTFSGYYNLGDWGRIGGYAWTRSALTGQRDEYRRRAFECFEYGAEYDYTWHFARDLGLYSYIDHIWSPSPGWYERSSTYHGVLFQQAIVNPFITPYYKTLAGYYPHQSVAFKLGLSHQFTLFEERLSLTPYAELINFDRRRYKMKYGTDPTERYCGLRPVATEFGVTAIYRIAEHIATRIRLRNWDLVEHAARIHERNRDVSWAVCWLPVITASIDITF